MHVEKKFHSEWTHCQKPFNNHYITIYSSIRKSSCVPFNNMCLIWARGASNVAWNMWCCESGTSFSSNLTLPCGNCTHQWEYMIPCSLLHNWLCNSLLTSFGEDNKGSCTPIRWCNCREEVSRCCWKKCHSHSTTYSTQHCLHPSPR